jgi:hypothetical protein
MLTSCTNTAAAVTPTLGVINSVWGAIVSPELAAGNQPANGSLITTTGGTPITVSQRGIRQASGLVTLGAGVTAGAAQLYQLCLDGNWRVISAALTLVASTNYWFEIGPTTSIGSFTITGGVPFLGLALVLSTALLGGNITYLELKGICDLFDRPFDV